MKRNDPWYDPRPTEEIIASILSNPDRDCDSYDDDHYWPNLGVITHRATREVWEAGVRLCASNCVFEQRLGCDILARLGAPEHPFRANSFDPIVSLLERTENNDTVLCVLYGLGHLCNPRAVPILLRYLRDPDADRRHAIAWALPHFQESYDVGPPLIDLSTDWEIDVRDWATFGLALLTDRDSAAVRNALVARADDDISIIRGEALRGLAERRDPRTYDLLAREFERPLVSELAIEAAETCGDPRSLELLLAARDRFEHWPELDAAIARLRLA